MPVVKAGRSRQVVIPKAVWDNFHLKPGDYFEVEVEDDRIVFVPKKLVGSDELAYWSKGTQADITAALEDVAAGRIKEFENVEDLIEDLNS
jgi:AbrB family looped-hinge helix DNA binding protein